MKLLDFFRVLRISQWYKNLLIFLPLLFSHNLFGLNNLILTLIGLASLCFISSSNYIINDIIDLKHDRFHPERRIRPLASGRVNVWFAGILAFICLILGIFIAYILDISFLYYIIALFILSSAYSLFLKKEAFADVLVIGINFVIRASSGAYIIDVKISPWLIIGVFFLSLFLSIGKRRADLIFLGKAAAKYKEVLKVYSKENTTALMIVSTALLIITYAFYSFSSEYSRLIFTLPFALYAIFRYFTLVFTGSEIARHPEKGIKDIRLVIGGLLWLVSVLIIIYLA